MVIRSAFERRGCTYCSPRSIIEHRPSDTDIRIPMKCLHNTACHLVEIWKLLTIKTVERPELRDEKQLNQRMQSLRRNRQFMKTKATSLVLPSQWSKTVTAHIAINTIDIRLMTEQCIHRIMKHFIALLIAINRFQFRFKSLPRGELDGSARCLFRPVFRIKRQLLAVFCCRKTLEHHSPEICGRPPFTEVSRAIFVGPYYRPTQFIEL